MKACGYWHCGSLTLNLSNISLYSLLKVLTWSTRANDLQGTNDLASHVHGVIYTVFITADC